MGEVGVDPQRVAQAASALEGLRDALAANVPTIVNTLSGYGAPVNTAALKQAQARSASDAAGMRSRARLAAIWQQQQVNLTGAGLVEIPWSGQALTNADAQAEAQALAAAEANKDPKAAMAAIQAIQQDVQDHLNANDGVWLASFYSQAAPQVAALATTLHNLDANTSNPGLAYANRFTVLTKGDQQTMATFARGLAAADKTGDLSPVAVQAIANAPDIWSATMLVKYGPAGSAWATSEQKGAGNPDGVSLLALMTQNLYSDLRSGNIHVPLGGGSYRYGPQDQQQLQNLLAQYDPMTVMLQADAQNRNAAWQVMGGPEGNGLGHMLLNAVNGDLPNLDGRFVQGGPNDRGQYPGFFTMEPPGKSINPDSGAIILSTPDQTALGHFLDAATSAPRGTGLDAGYSARAAVNIISNLMGPITDNGKIQPGYDPAVQKALSDTFLRYLPDLAASSGDPVNLTGAAQDQYAQGHPWEITIGQGKLSTLIQDLSATPQSCGYLKGIIAAKMGTVLGMQLNGLTAGNGDLPAQYASLYGRFTTEASNLHYTAQQQLDAQNAELNSLISFGEGEVGSIPIIGPTASKVLTWDQKMQFLGVPQIPQYSTDNAANAIQQGRQVFSQQQMVTMIPLVQGLVQQGIIKPDPSWYQNNQIVPNQAFDQWWKNNSGLPVKVNGTFMHLDEVVLNAATKGIWPANICGPMPSASASAS